MAKSSTRLVLICGRPASGKAIAERRTAPGEWTASPMTRAHFENWATIFQSPDEEEILLFDKPAKLHA